MASLPYFVRRPNSILSLAGSFRRRRPEDDPEPFGDYRRATVDVVISARNEEQMVMLSLASVLRQTLAPRRIILVDAGSSDGTAELALAFADRHRVNLVVMRRSQSVGRTVTLKHHARELDCDVLMVLDADTVLDSPDYMERLVRELYKGPGVASVCGTIRPLSLDERRHLADAPLVRAVRTQGGPDPLKRKHWWGFALATGITNIYRDALYLFLQRFIHRGEMKAFGTSTNPIGCAVAYRRVYLARLFDEVEPESGDDLTNSEDICIVFALLARGYRNVQLSDVFAKTVEPRMYRPPRQNTAGSPVSPEPTAPS